MEQFRCLSCMAEYDDNLDYCPHCGEPKNFRQKDIYFLKAGTILENRYIVGKALSDGAFNISYLAFDYKENKKVVIKEYFPKDLASRMLGQNEIAAYDGEKAKQYESGLVAFIEENNNLKSLSNSLEGVAKIYDLFIDNSTAYSVVEYIEGIPLSEVLKRGALPWNDLVQVMNPLLKSMEIIHSAGIVNYNISPDNIIMTRDKSVKLLSFGGAKLATKLGSIIKKGYSPVELYKENPTNDPAIDVYSIAAVMYYAVTGVVPEDALDRSSNDKLLSPASLGVDIPDNVDNAIMNALNVNRQYRTPDCATFFDELNSTRDVRRIYEEKKKEETGKISKKTKIIIIVSAIVAIAAIIGIVAGATRLSNSGDGKSKTSQGETLRDYADEYYDECKDEIEDIAEKYNIEVDYNYKIDPNMSQGEGRKITKVTPTPDTDKLSKIEKLKIDILIPPVKMPSLYGCSKSEAIKRLTKLQIKESKINFSFKRTNESPQGTVVYQSVSKGELINDLGTEIYISLANNYTVTTTTKARRSSSGSPKRRSSSGSKKKKSSDSENKSRKKSESDNSNDGALTGVD